MRTLENRYALALFELTQNEEGLRAGAQLLTGDAALWKALLNPCIPAVEKDRVLCRLLGQGDDPVLLGFFRLLCRRERLSLLPAVVERYHQLKLKAEGGAQGVFTCARSLPRRTWNGSGRRSRNATAFPKWNSRWWWIPSCWGALSSSWKASPMTRVCGVCCGACGAR